jgi:hypothetical protein
MLTYGAGIEDVGDERVRRRLVSLQARTRPSVQAELDLRSMQIMLQQIRVQRLRPSFLLRDLLDVL